MDLILDVRFNRNECYGNDNCQERQMKLSTISALTVSALVLASVSGTALASHASNYKGDYKNEMPCPTPPSLMDGWYLGAQAGYDSYRIRQSISGVGEFSSTASATGWVGGLFAGYGQYFSNYYYLGGELLANYNGNNQTTFSMVDNDGDSANQKFEAKGTWGISLLPGIKLNDTTLGYVRLGYNWTNFEASDSAADAGVTASGSKSNTEGGFDFGLGLETLVYQNWSVRTEYNHVWYNSFNFNAGPASESFDPSDNQFTLGVLYHFA